ncbi:MAG TPA: LacI family DNA-binding transcriptional regulator [Candidatus Limiplasma stercoravium]|nr:LacI family DNA-binding transcriptional regulator [Candidatus Limiplasma stercoravium]
MKATIKDVAREAGVSPSTVSRALHNNPRISSEVRQRIQEIAVRLDFHPNQMARSLVSRKTRIVGIVFPGDAGQSLGHPFFPAVLQGLGHAASERRYHLLLATGSEAVTIAEASRQLVDSGYVSGLIILAAEASPQLDVSVPVVVIGRPADARQRHYVDNNNVAAGYAAARYLLDRGHRRVMLLGYDPHYNVTVDRLDGYRRALEEAGLTPREDWIVPSRFIHNTTDNEALSHIFLSEDRPTAVVSMDDALSIGLMGLLGGMGLSVPQQVSIISFNNTDAGRYHVPALTSFDVDPYRLGLSAMNLMLDILKGQVTEPSALEVPFSLVERGSVEALGSGLPQW